MTNKEVVEMMPAMKNKSCELGTVPMALLKKILPRCIETITQLVNISLTMGEFCLEWKTAVVRLLLKKPGLELLYKNYRLVLNLCFFSKLVKKCMLKQLMQHCERYNLLPDFQSAYRRNYSTETSLIKMVNDILWGMEKQEITMVIILDLSAAFDTVDHDVLLAILCYRK